jgi:hypothetical protein
MLLCHAVSGVVVLFRSDPDLQRLIADHKKAWYKQHPERSGSGVYEARLNSQLGIPLDFDSLNTSMVYAPGDVADRWVGVWKVGQRATCAECACCACCLGQGQ